LLALLAPATINDPEVLSAWGAINARRWELVGDRDALDTAVSAYRKAFHLRSDYRDGIALAFLLNACASVSEATEGIADFVDAQRVRREVIAICRGILEKAADRNRSVEDEYSLRAALAEAWYGLGEEVKYLAELGLANSLSPHSSVREATEDRIAQLAMLMEFSPLRYMAAV
jgi:hypothetical protein